MMDMYFMKQADCRAWVNATLVLQHDNSDTLSWLYTIDG
jgi:hypothetical protein